MAVATYVAPGDRIEYTPGSDVSAGAVVDLGNVVGIAITDIAANTKGALWIQGVFDVAKYSGEGITIYDRIYYDAGTATATKTSGYGEATMGIAVKAALAGDATVRVLLMPTIA